jgi:N-methylhydantoinase B
MTLDAVTLALVQNRLDHITKQMGWVMTRTARSPIFNHAHDFSCFLTDATGIVVAQADGIPIHTGGGGFAARALLGVFGDDMGPDDAFLLSDPYVAGGNHLPDWVIVRPVFCDGKFVALSCIRAHQSDIGGGAAGTYNPEAREIYHEGIRLPALRLIENGKTREDLWQLLLLNCRTPHYLDGDLRAMLGATRIGAQQVESHLQELGVAEGLAYMDGILDHADRRMRAAIAELPDGVYRGEDWFDNDCFEPMDIRICVNLTVDGDTMTVDFTGSHEQIQGFKNSSFANTYSSVYMALSSYFDPAIPRNEGTYRGVKIIAPEGSIVNPLPPAPVTMSTVFPACEIIHAVWRALAEADAPKSCAGWGKNAFPITSGIGDDGNTFVMYHWFGSSGGGAVDGRDGFPQQGGLNSLCGLHIPNAETFEQLFPIRFVRQELRCDAAGPGKYRGGAGGDYAVDILAPVQYAFRGEGYTMPTGFGIGGGKDGAMGHMTVTPEAGDPITPPAYGVRHIAPSRLEMNAPGGGGWGDPLERDPALVLQDVRDGIVSAARALEDYGVVFQDDGIDMEETARHRASLRG